VAGSGTFVGVVEAARFAPLRQSLGYAMANELLQALAARLIECVAGAEIGRIGRSTIEFAFHAANPATAMAVMIDTARYLQSPMDIDGLSFVINVAIGLADAGDRGICDELVDVAARALPDAHMHVDRVGMATDRVADAGITYGIDLLRDLRRAPERGELSLCYQPKLHARLDRFTSAEALLRWDHPRLGRIPTEKFIALAENTGSIRPLTEWVLAEAIRGQRAIKQAGHDLEIYINLSGMLLHDHDFAEFALGLAADAVGPLGFEITETAVIEEPAAALANLRAFNQAGIKIAIDDYGSGLSSLAYLKQLPAQELKIDRMFVSGLIDSHKDPLLVRSSIDLAHALEMEVTAEGVDDAMSLSLLRIMGCDLLQGFLICQPVPLNELIAVLNDKDYLNSLVQPSSSTSNWPVYSRLERI